MTSTTKTIPETPIGERVAADLHTLAEFAIAHPEVAHQLAETVATLTIVLPRSHQRTPDEVAEAAIAVGATPAESGWSEPHWPSRAVALPAQGIRLQVIKLAPEPPSTSAMADEVWSGFVAELPMPDENAAAS
jgi:hypothetical protein